MYQVQSLSHSTSSYCIKHTNLVIWLSKTVIYDTISQINNNLHNLLYRTVIQPKVLLVLMTCCSLGLKISVYHIITCVGDIPSQCKNKNKNCRGVIKGKTRCEALYGSQDQPTKNPIITAIAPKPWLWKLQKSTEQD